MSTKPNPLPEGWIPFDQAVTFIQEHVTANGPARVGWLMDNWDCKYINLRVDMRTGMVHMEKGNAVNRTS